MEKQKLKTVANVSLLIVENQKSSSAKEIKAVKDSWVKGRIAMDSGTAGHVMQEDMLPRVTLERKTAQKEVCR